MVDVPVVAVELAVRVRVLVPVVLEGLNDAVTPLGNPDAKRVTLLLKPFSLFTAIELAPDVPCVMVTVAGDAESVKSAAAVTVRVTLVVWVRAPDFPVIVTVEVPLTAEVLAESVRLLVPVVVDGLNDAVMPLGSPDADRLTVPEKPFSGVIFTAVAPLPPWARVMLEGDAERLKSAGAAVPARASIMAWPAGLPQPVTRSYPVTALNVVGGLLPLRLFPVVMS